MPACIYCGRDAGEYDEHEECVDASAEAALELEAELDTELEESFCPAEAPPFTTPSGGAGSGDET